MRDSPCAWVMFGKWPTRITVLSLATDMAPVINSRASELRMVFICCSKFVFSA